MGVLVGAGVRVGFGVLVGVTVRVGFGDVVDTAVAVGFGVFDGAAPWGVGEDVEDAVAVSCAIFAGPGVDTDFLMQPPIATSKTRVLNSAYEAWRLMTFPPVQANGSFWYSPKAGQSIARAHGCV